MGLADACHHQVEMQWSLQHPFFGQAPGIAVAQADQFAGFREPARRTVPEHLRPAPQADLCKPSLGHGHLPPIITFICFPMHHVPSIHKGQISNIEHQILNVEG